MHYCFVTDSAASPNNHSKNKGEVLVAEDVPGEDEVM